MNKTLIALALMLPLSCFAAKSGSAKTASKAEAASPFTNERNQAAGNLSTSLVVMQKMAYGCKIPQTDELIKSSIKEWQQRNKAYLQMHYGYVTAYIESVKEAAGEAEAKKLTASMIKVNNDQSNTIIEAMIKKDGNATACEKYFTYMAGGAMDIKKGSSDYKTLTEMLNFVQSQK